MKRADVPQPNQGREGGGGRDGGLEKRVRGQKVK
jgi:hypothetical protein